MSAPRHAADADPAAAAERAFAELDLAGDAPVLVAVSGGGDSTALVHLFRHHLARLPSAPPIIAATVDHRLRPESTGEAMAVARMCERLGTAHRIVTWDGPARSTGLQVQAREARHALLADLARSIGAGIVLTGHTADDNAETLAMRKARQGVAGIGLAGIDRAALYRRAVWFVRPLLDCGRADLRAWLAARGIGFIDDPSNEDSRFERVRVRRALTREPAWRAALVAQASAQRARRAARALAGARCLDRAEVWRFDGAHLWFDPAAGEAACTADALAAAMAGALTWTGRLARQPGARQTGAALAFCRQGANGAAFTIAGCTLARRDGRVRLAADPRHARGLDDVGFNRLVAETDRPLAQALARLHGAAGYRPPPWRVDHNHALSSHNARIGLAKC
ncbi:MULTISPECIES: tRNA lysidine(34) synthetase TilS [unclassified Roseitalea]|uniref:tRNA lysidine(34) synthetase TilS n=1 Tax=unclassified Roseitalea TaxID=2639107 RepID=UPI00273F25A5|nr:MULTISPECIES: tRNA lysidine(34) synthetase TilS [unclassified Roseitalea]